MQMLASGKQQEAVSPRQERGARRRLRPSAPSSLAAGGRAETTQGTGDGRGRGQDGGAGGAAQLWQSLFPDVPGHPSTGLGNQLWQSSRGDSTGTRPLGSNVHPTRRELGWWPWKGQKASAPGGPRGLQGGIQVAQLSAHRADAAAVASRVGATPHPRHRSRCRDAEAGGISGYSLGA